jgi:hypothetical protein
MYAETACIVALASQPVDSFSAPLKFLVVLITERYITRLVSKPVSVLTNVGCCSKLPI